MYQFLEHDGFCYDRLNIVDEGGRTVADTTADGFMALTVENDLNKQRVVNLLAENYQLTALRDELRNQVWQVATERNGLAIERDELRAQRDVLESQRDVLAEAVNDLLYVFYRGLPPGSWGRNVCQNALEFLEDINKVEKRVMDLRQVWAKKEAALTPAGQEAHNG